MACVEMLSHRLVIFERNTDLYEGKRDFGPCDSCSRYFCLSGAAQVLTCSKATRNTALPLAGRALRKSRPHRLCAAFRSCLSESLYDSKTRDRIITGPGFRDYLKQESFVHWFREAWPYIQGHRSSVCVIVIPGDVSADSTKIDGVLQDILLLHGLGVKLVVIPGTQPQIDELLIERGLEPEYEGAYRITGREALEASMEAAGRIRVTLEAKLSRGTSFPSLRRAGDNDRWNEVAVASGNYLAAKRRGVVNGVDFGATGEVKRIDVHRIRQDLDKGSIVLLSNLGYSSSGEVLNCNMYEVATACAIALQADKLLCLLDGPVFDEDGRHFRFMTLGEADKLIRERASQSLAAADYVKAVAGPAYVKSLGLPLSTCNGSVRNAAVNGASNGSLRTNGHATSKQGETVNASNGSLHTNGHATSRQGETANNNQLNGYARNSSCMSHVVVVAAETATPEEKDGKGFAIGGLDRFSRTHGYLSELTAAVYACRHGVGRVHLLDSNVNGALLLELYSRDGVGNMVSSDSYEGTRRATSADIPTVLKLLEPFVEEGILVNRPSEELKQEIKNYIVVERDGSIIACCALFPYEKEKCCELAAFAVSPECRGSGIGTSLLEYVEKRAGELELEKIFVLTTRTADWFVQRGFKECTVDILPESRRHKIDFSRRSKYYEKYIKLGANNGVLTFS